MVLTAIVELWSAQCGHDADIYIVRAISLSALSNLNLSVYEY